MNFVLSMLLYLIVLTSVIAGWQYNVGLTLRAHDIFGVLFIFCYFPFLITKGNRFTLNRPVKTFLMFYVGFFFIEVFSSVGLFYFSMETTIDFTLMFDQFLKGIIYQPYMLILFFCIAHFLSQKPHEDNRKVALAFVCTIIASCVYQFVSLFLMINYKIAIDEIIWPAISYNHFVPDSTFMAKRALGYSIDGGLVSMYRMGGFALNSNSLGAQILCVIPFLLLNVIHKRNKTYILLSLMAICSLILTMSRSALLGLAISCLCLIFIERAKIIKLLNPSVLLVIFSVTAISVLFWDHLWFFYRGQNCFELSDRGDLFDLAWRTFIDNPLGIGCNNSSNLARQGITGLPDLHSFWLIKLVETGFIGFIYYLIFSFFILHNCYKRSNIFSKSLFCSYLGVMTACIFNNNLATFPGQFFVFLFFCTAMLESQNRKKLSERIKYEN